MIHSPLTKTYEGVAESIAAIIRDVSPFALCPTCIAAKATTSESRVRHAMQVLVSTTADFVVTTRVCHGCHAATRLVALRAGFATRGAPAQAMQ
jgi:hypothetical protein